MQIKFFIIHIPQYMYLRMNIREWVKIRRLYTPRDKGRMRFSSDTSHR
jgi:hypothetical protein